MMAMLDQGDGDHGVKVKQWEGSVKNPLKYPTFKIDRHRGNR